MSEPFQGVFKKEEKRWVFEDDDDPPISRQQQNFERIAGPDLPAVTPSPLRSLFDFPLVPDGDQSILLGDRYLNRGDGAVVVSTSGMGKSALCVQGATELALNRGPFGIQGNGPLKSLIMQSEDSDGDVAEVAHSIKVVLGLSEAQIAEVNSRVKVVCDRVNRGQRFIAALKKHVEEFQPDLVWINPLQAFIDGDVTDSKDLGSFLREGLNSINPCKFGYILVHHTTKPPQEKKDRQWNEVMYDMAGGAEIINWARAILSLRATAEEGNFNLVLAKRGRRAGVTRKVPCGVGFTLEPVTTIPLQHAKGHIELPGYRKGIPKIYWESRDHDEEEAPVRGSKGGRPSLYDFEEAKDRIPLNKAEGMTLEQLFRQVKVDVPFKDTQALYNSLSRWRKKGFVDRVENPTGQRWFRLV